MIYLDTITSLFNYAIKRFPQPQFGWNDKKIKFRSYEQSFSEQLILDCYDNITTNPKDVIFGKYMYYDYILSQLDDRSLMKEVYECASRTCNILLSYLETV